MTAVGAAGSIRRGDRKHAVTPRARPIYESLASATHDEFRVMGDAQIVARDVRSQEPPRTAADDEMMSPSQRAQVRSRDRADERVRQMTRWIAAGAGLAVAVIGVVLAQGPASASTPTAASSQPGDTAGGGSQNGLATPSTSPNSSPYQYGPPYSGQFGGGGLQAPAAPPQSYSGSGPSVLSGGS